MEDCFYSLLITCLPPTFFYIYLSESYNLSFVENKSERSFCACTRPHGCCNSSGHIHTPEGLQCRVPWANAGPCWPISALRCCCAPCLTPAFTHTQGFVHHSLDCFGDSFLPRHGWCLCSAVGERSPCARACWAWAPREMHPQGMAFLSLCLCRQESHLRQKPSLRRTRAWCGSCWSSCGLAWTCLGWCCPPSSWSHARSSTNSPTTTTMPTCSPSKQHTGWAWPGHLACVCQNISVCARKAPKRYWDHWPQHRPGTSCSDLYCCQWGPRKEELNSRQTHLCTWTCLPLLAGTDGNSADALEFCTAELCHLLVYSCTKENRTESNQNCQDLLLPKAI